MHKPTHIRCYQMPLGSTICFVNYESFHSVLRQNESPNGMRAILFGMYEIPQKIDYSYGFST